MDGNGGYFVVKLMFNLRQVFELDANFGQNKTELSTYWNEKRYIAFGEL